MPHPTENVTTTPGQQGYISPPAVQNGPPVTPPRPEDTGNSNPYSSWNQNQWASALADPSKMNAGQLENAIYQGWITPAAANAALVQKDSWLRAANRYQSGYGGYGYGGYSAPYANPATGAMNWMSPFQFQPLQGDWGAPVRQFNIQDVNWQGLPPQYRQPTTNWLQAQGFQPNQQSLGQYGYRNWSAPQPTTINSEAINSIPDPNFQAWVKALFGMGQPPAA